MLPGTHPTVEESQGGSYSRERFSCEDSPTPTTHPPEAIPALKAFPDPTQLPASTASARLEEGVPKRRHIANKRYTNSEYELRLAKTGDSEVIPHSLSFEEQ